MKIEFHCAACGGHMTSEDQFRGEVIRCPSCGGEVVVPLTTVGPGAVVAGFKIVRKIGTGGMGSVYLAEQTSMGRQVALKVLPPAYTRDQLFLDRFLKEIRLQGALSHPNIATAFDAGKFHDIYYLAMEFVEGQDLCDLIAQQKQVEEKTALRIVRKAAAGLAYAWSRQHLIHRDIKPANIMIAHGEEVKILDLGVSKSGTRSGDAEHATEEAVIGTPHYMSPEQARESASVDLRSDIYSLGATLYHMVTGRMPFPGDNLVEVVTRQVSGPAPAPQSLNPRVSAPCEHLLEVMMAREASERYENWDDCIADIGRVLGGRSPLAPRPLEHGSMIEAPSLPEQSELPEVEKERTAIPLVAALTIVLIGFLVWGVMANRPRTPPLEPTSDLSPVTPPAAGPGVGDPPPVRATDSTARSELEARLTRLMQRGADGKAARDLQQDFRTLAEDAWRQGEADIADQVREQLADLRHQRAAAARAVLDELESEVQPWVERGDFLEAANRLRAYGGPGALATARARLSRAQALEAQARERAEAAWADIREQVLTEILASSSVDSAMALVVRAQKESWLDPVRAQVVAAEQELARASLAPSEIMASFAGDMGKAIVVVLTRGSKRLVITGMGPDSVSGTQELAQGSLTYTFQYRDLALQEKVSRLARIGTPACQFMLGLLALEAGEYQHAISSFRRAGGDLTAALAQRLTQSQAASEAANHLE